MSNELIPHPRTLADVLATELATVLGALTGGAGGASAVGEHLEPAWIVPSTLRGAATGTLSVGFSQADAARLAQLVMGFDEEPSADAIADMVQEVTAQAFGALGQKPVARGLELCSGSARHDEGARSTDGDVIVYRVTLTPEFSPLVAVWVRLERALPPAEARPAAAPPAPRQNDARPPAPPNLDVILDIDLPLSVRFGEASMTLETLTTLGPGSMIDLGRSPDEPVDVLVNGRLVARGEVVVVGGNYGVRILEIVSAADRVRTLGG